MTDHPSGATQIVAVAPPRSSWKDWAPFLSALVTIVLAIVAGLMVIGDERATAKHNTRRIDQLEVRVTRQEHKATELEVKWARIEAKLDLVLERLTAGR
jgi:hypothetical protein